MYLVVLDYCTGITTVYPILGGVIPTQEETEEFLNEQGYSEQNINWMLSNEINFKKGEE